MMMFYKTEAKAETKANKTCLLDEEEAEALAGTCLK